MSINFGLNGILLNLLITEQQMPDFNDTALETQLRRFLYIGKQNPVYQPGNWFAHDYFLAKNLSCIDELAVNPLKHDAVISSIVEVCTIHDTCTLVMIVVLSAKWFS